MRILPFRLTTEQKKQKGRQILGPCQKIKISVEPEGEGDSNCSWCVWNGPQSPRKRTWRTGIQRKNRDHPDYRLIEIGQKCSKDLRRLVVTQTPVNAGVKNSQEIMIIIITILLSVRFDASSQSSKLFHLLFVTHIVYLSSLRIKALCIVINFLIL